MSTRDADEASRLDLPAAALVVLCCALWGGNSVAVKFTVEHIPPIGCAGLRFLISLVVIVFWCRVDGTALRLERSHVMPAVWNALLLFLQMATFNWGTQQTHAGRASVFINIHPFLVAPVAWLVLNEPMGWRGVVGLLVAGAGVALLFEKGGADGASLAGDLAVIASGLLIGATMLYQKSLLRRFRPNHLLFWQLALSLPLFGGYSLAFEGLSHYQFPTAALTGLAYQGLLVSGFCFIAWMSLLRRYPANQLAAFGFLTPFFGITAANMLRGEPLGLTLVGGCSLVAWGLYLVTRPVAR